MNNLETITYTLIATCVEGVGNCIWMPRLIHVGRLNTITVRHG
jgi:hypothetical protein